MQLIPQRRLSNFKTRIAISFFLFLERSATRSNFLHNPQHFCSRRRLSVKFNTSYLLDISFESVAQFLSIVTAHLPCYSQ